MNTALQPIADQIRFKALQIIAKPIESDYKLQNKWHKFCNRIDHRDYRAIQAYTGADYRPINAILRNTPMDDMYGYDMSDSWVNLCHQYIRGIKRIIRNGASLNRKMFTAYRGTNLKHFGTAAIENPESLIGSVFTDSGFPSASLDRDHASVWALKRSHPALLEIIIPEHSKGAYIASMSNCGHESEFLLDSNSQYKIMGVYKERGIWIIQAILVGSKSKAESIAQPAQPPIMLWDVMLVHSIVKTYQDIIRHIARLIVLSG